METGHFRQVRFRVLMAFLVPFTGLPPSVEAQIVTTGVMSLTLDAEQTTSDLLMTTNTRTLQERETGTTRSVVTDREFGSRMTPEEQARQEKLLAASVADDYRENLSLAPAIHHDLEVEVAKVRFSGNRSLPPNQPMRRFVATTETLAGPIGRQPEGALSGKIIYCSGGHGWTNDNTSTSLWYTQRPCLHGMIEDFGNLDQFNLYAEYCFRAGATVVPMRPLGFQRLERLVDNGSPEHAGFQGRWYDSESTVAFSLWNEKVPYRFAIASLQETAVARFRPSISKPDYYPVYAWARAGADRVNQTYRIVHSGGATDVQVNHRRVGNGWVYLGEYHFDRGEDGYVEISNRVSDPAEADGAHVVIADAIRFGNGLGDVNRGGGISGRPREEEAARYWCERQLSQGVDPIFEAFEGTDQGTNVGTSPRLSAHMNREREGSFFDRVFLSFHSNASGASFRGRGMVGLFCVQPSRRPDHQVDWAEMLAQEINQEMLSPRVELPFLWFVHSRLSHGHINYGEIRRDSINNEMTATIAEVAFHDHPLDAQLLRMLSVREAMARGAYRATTRYFNRFGSPSVSLELLPEAPVILSVVTEETSNILVRWAPARNPSNGGPVEAYRIYHSENGFGFDGGVKVTGALWKRYSQLKPGVPHYFRITAENSSGESRPSPVLGTYSVSDLPRVLLLSGFSSISDDLVVTQTAPSNLGQPNNPGGEFARLIPRLLNPGSQVAVAGEAMVAASYGFDSVTADAVSTSPLQLTHYSALVGLFGRQTPSQRIVSPELQTTLTAYLREGGALFVSGSTLARSLDEATTRPAAEERKFAFDILGFRHGGNCCETESAVGEPNSLLSTMSLQLADPSTPEFLSRENDVITAGVSSIPLLRYQNAARNVAATYKDAGHTQGAVIAFGFPFEEIVGRSVRRDVLGRIMTLLGVSVDQIPVPPAPVVQAPVVIKPAAKPKPAQQKPRPASRRRSRR